MLAAYLGARTATPPGGTAFSRARSLRSRDPIFARADELADRLHKLAIEVGGTVTGEHGTGAVRARYMRAEHGDALDVMKRIKNVMDPKGLLNPGKLYGP